MNRSKKSSLIVPGQDIIGVPQKVDMSGPSLSNSIRNAGGNTQDAVEEEEFFKQLKAFSKVDFKKEWGGHSLKTKSYHVRIFILQTFKNGELLVTDVDGEERLSKDSILGRKFTHVAKIVRLGEGLDKPLYQEGDIVLLNRIETTGLTINPDFAISERNQKAFGYSLIEPKGMPKSIENIQVRFADFILSKPQDYDKPKHLIYDFAIPEHKILESYSI